MTGALDPGAFALPIGTVTFLLTDIEGSTQQWQRNASAMGRAVERAYAILDDAISAHRGVRPIEQGEGDSVVAAFSRASDAVLAARSAQQALQAERWPTDEPVLVRMAVHTGDATLRDEGNYMGQTIIRTARLRAIAHGGQVLLSSVTRDLTVDQLGDDVQLIPLGSHRLKDLARPEDVWQLVHDQTSMEFPPLRSLDAIPNNLPVHLSSFVGRLDEIATVAALMRGNRLVTITGSGGAGKTRLSLQVAAEVADSFASGTWWVELVGVTDGAAVPGAVAAAIGARTAPGAPPADAVKGFVADRAMFIVLDNCEHVVAAAARFVDELLRACPNLSVLTTSRIALDVPGEVTWRVPALALPPTRSAVSIAALGQYDAVRLFVDRAKRVRPNFSLNDENGAVIAEICQRLDGIPLALELAAARCRSLSPIQICEGLTDSLRMLTGGARTVLPRQQTLEASIDWSHSLLSDVDRALLRRLSVFVGGFTLDAAEVVTADRAAEASTTARPVALGALDVLDGLDRLVEQSLVSIDEGDSGGATRYRLLETVRQYARRELVSSDEERAHLDAHCDYYVAMTKTVGDLGRVGVAVEADNAMAALAHMSLVGTKEAHAEFTAALVVGLLVTHHSVELDRVIDVCLARFDDSPSIPKAHVLLARSRLRFFFGQIEPALSDADVGLEIGEAIGDAEVIALALNLQGSSHMMSNPTRAIERLERAVALATQVERWPLVIDSYNALGFAHLTRHELDAALAAFDSQAAIEREHPLPYLVGHEYVGRAAIALRLADFDLVTRCVGPIRKVAEGLGDPMLDPVISFIEGSVALETDAGLDDAVIARLHADLAAAEENHQYFGVCFIARALAVAMLALGDLTQARRHCDVVVAIASMGYRDVEVEGQLLSAQLDQHQGDVVAALRATDRARTVAESLGNPVFAAQADIRHGLIALTQRDIGSAESLIHGALAVVAERGLRREVIQSLEALVLTESASNRLHDAARLHGASSRLRDEVGYRIRLSPEREAYAEAIASIESGLADAGVSAISEGKGLTWQEAVAFAQRMRGTRRRPAFGWDSLTPTESQVVELAAEGLTNPQIAERLIMGRATVKTHLSSAFSKLGVRNRTELATAVSRFSERAAKVS